MFTQSKPLSSFACRTSSCFGIVHKCYVSKWIDQIRATKLEASLFILSCRKVDFGLSLKVLLIFFFFSLIFFCSFFSFHCLLFYFLYFEIKSFLLLTPDAVNTSRNGTLAPNVILLSVRIIRCSIWPLDVINKAGGSFSIRGKKRFFSSYVQLLVPMASNAIYHSVNGLKRKKSPSQISIGGHYF